MYASTALLPCSGCAKPSFASTSVQRVDSPKCSKRPFTPSKIASSQSEPQLLKPMLAFQNRFLRAQAVETICDLKTSIEPLIDPCMHQAMFNFSLNRTDPTQRVCMAIPCLSTSTSCLFTYLLTRKGPCKTSAILRQFPHHACEGGRTTSQYNVFSFAQTRQARKKYAEAPERNLEPRSCCTTANVQHVQHPASWYVQRPMFR